MTFTKLSVSLPSKARTSSPKAERTNTLAITQLPKSFFQAKVLEALRNYFATFGSINQWVPLPTFGRVIVVFESEDHAEEAKVHSDPIVIQGSKHRSNTTLRVYRADPNPLIPRGSVEMIVPEGNYLRPPAIEKNFLISPPGSPPEGWEQGKEDPPNATPLADDLIAALQTLQAHSRRRSTLEILLDPQEGPGVGVYVQDCDGKDDDETETKEEVWVYGEPSPGRKKWRPVPAALPQMRAVVF